MLAQLVGLPGSGKSTLAARLEELDPDRFGRVTVEPQTIPALLARRPLGTLAVLARLSPFIVYTLLAARSPLGWRDRFLPVTGLLNLLLAHRQLRREAADASKVYLYDEFVYQRALSLFGTSTRLPPRIVLRAFLSVLRRAFVLPIFVAADAAEARRRATDRAAGLPQRLAGLEPDIVEKIYANQAALLGELRALSPRALRIDTRGDLARSLEQARSRLRDLTSRGRESVPKVAHFVFNLTGYSGAAQQALALCRRLEGFDPILFNCTRSRRGESAASGDEVHVVRLSRNVVSSAIAIAYTTWLYRIRIFHLHGPVAAALIAGVLLRRRLVLKTTLLGWDDLDSLAGDLKGRILRAFAKRVDANVALSSAIAEINRKHLPAEKVLVLPNAVDIRTPAAAKRDPIFCVVGLVCRRKRTHLAIERFLDGYADLEGARLVVIGPHGDVPELDEGSEEYFQYCVSLIPPERRSQIEFTGGLGRGEVEELYRASLALLLFSRSEGLPNALLEAMAANCVPITSELGGVAREVIENGESGFVVGDEDPLPDVEALRACSESRAPRRRIEACYTFEVLTERYSRLYSSLLHPRGVSS